MQTDKSSEICHYLTDAEPEQVAEKRHVTKLLWNVDFKSVAGNSPSVLTPGFPMSHKNLQIPHKSVA